MTRDRGLNLSVPLFPSLENRDYSSSSWVVGGLDAGQSPPDRDGHEVKVSTG